MNSNHTRTIETAISTELIKDIIAEKLHTLGFVFKDEYVTDLKLDFGKALFPMVITLEKEVQTVSSNG